MTNEGINRIANLFLQDIAKLTFTLDGVAKEKTIFKSSAENGNVNIIFQIAREETGEFDNFKLIGKDNTVYSKKILQFKKENDEVLIEFSFSFTVEEVIS